MVEMKNDVIGAVKKNDRVYLLLVIEFFVLQYGCVKAAMNKYSVMRCLETTME